MGVSRIETTTVFVAGGSGTIGGPLVRALVAAGHRVFATTRHKDRQLMIRSLGATPLVVDALDAAALERAVREAAPTHVIHQLTALPKGGVRRAADLEPTNRLREIGTRNLLRAAIAARATRFIGGSFALIGASLDASVADLEADRAAQAVSSMESQIIQAARSGAIEGLVLRYGLFYGPGTPSTDEMLALVRKRRLPRIRDDRGRLPNIHLADAVSATVAALDRGSSGAIYDIVDDHPMSFSEMVACMAEVVGAPKPLSVPGWLVRLAAPYMARLLSVNLPISNARARAELAWAPRYPSLREGLRQAAARAA